jgi:formate dehydrogenase iron-sulfur subunit
VACKEWNQLKGTETKNTGSHENPRDLSENTWKIVRFNEGKTGNGGGAYWHFFTEQCRHCLTPGCMSVVEKDEIVQDEKTGAVIFTKKTKDLAFEPTREGCPYDIPRRDPESKQMFKCTMCIDRITSGMIPACVKACPTGAMQFGTREKILKMAQAAVKELKKSFPKANAVHPDDVRVIYVLKDDPKTYWKMAAGG